MVAARLRRLRRSIMVVPLSLSLHPLSPRSKLWKSIYVQVLSTYKLIVMSDTNLQIQSDMRVLAESCVTWQKQVLRYLRAPTARPVPSADTTETEKPKKIALRLSFQIVDQQEPIRRSPLKHIYAWPEPSPFVVFCQGHPRPRKCHPLTKRPIHQTDPPSRLSSKITAQLLLFL